MRMAELDVVLNNRYVHFKEVKTEYFYEISTGDTYYRLQRDVPYEGKDLYVYIKLPYELKDYQYDRGYVDRADNDKLKLAIEGTIKDEVVVIGIRSLMLKDSFFNEDGVTTGRVFLNNDKDEVEIKFILKKINGRSFKNESVI